MKSRLYPSSGKPRLGYRMVQKTMRFCLRQVFHASISGAASVPGAGPCLIACNHASYIDPILIGSALPRELIFLAKADLFRIPILSTWLGYLNVIGVVRDGKHGGPALMAILSGLHSGAAALIFPQGHRMTKDATALPQHGVGWLVIRSGATVVPARVFGTGQAWPRDKLLPRPRPVAFEIWFRHQR